MMDAKMEERVKVLLRDGVASFDADGCCYWVTEAKYAGGFVEDVSCDAMRVSKRGDVHYVPDVMKLSGMDEVSELNECRVILLDDETAKAFLVKLGWTKEEIAELEG